MSELVQVWSRWKPARYKPIEDAIYVFGGGSTEIGSRRQRRGTAKATLGHPPGFGSNISKIAVRRTIGFSRFGEVAAE